MKPHNLAGFMVVAALASACADPFAVGAAADADVATVKISGSDQDLSVAHPGLFDLDVAGDGHILWIPSGNAIRMMRVSGVHHEIIVSTGASVQSIRLSGVGTTIHLPKNVHPAVSGDGVDGRILHDSEGMAGQRETAKEVP